MDPFDDLFGDAPVVAAPPPPRATSNTVPTQGDDFGEFFVPASSPVVLSSSSHTNQQQVKEGEDDGFGDFAGSGSGVPQAESTKGDDLDFGNFEGNEASPSSSQPPAREQPDTSPLHLNRGSSNTGATASPPIESSKGDIDDIFGDFGSVPQPAPAAPLEVAKSALVGNRPEADESPSPQELPITAPPSRLNKPPIAPEIGIAATDVPVHTVGTLDDDDFGDFGSAPPSPVKLIREEGTYSQPIQQEEPNEQQPPAELSPEFSPQKEDVSTLDQLAPQVQEAESIASGAEEDEFGDFGSPVPPTAAEEVPHVEASGAATATSPLQTSTQKDDEPITLKEDGEDDFGSSPIPVEVPESRITDSDSTANPIVPESEEAGFGTFESSPVINNSPDIEASCIPVDSNQNSYPPAETTMAVEDEEFGDFGVATPPLTSPLQPVPTATEAQAQGTQATEEDHPIPKQEDAENDETRFGAFEASPSPVVGASAVGAVVTSVQKQVEVIESEETEFGDFGESPLPDAQTQLSPGAAVINPEGDVNDDDFGDFEESAQPPVTETIPLPTTSKNNAEEVNDDEFGDFGSADPMPQQQPQLPVVVASLNAPAHQVIQSNAKFDRQLAIMQEGFKELQPQGTSKKPLFASSATQQQLDEDTLDWWAAQDGIMGTPTSKIQDSVSIQRDADALLTAVVESFGIGRFVTINGSDMSSHDPKSLAAFLSLEALASNGGVDARTRRQAESLSSYAAASPLPVASPIPPPQQPQRPVAARFRPLIRDLAASDGSQTFNEPEAAPVYGSIRASGWAFYRYLMPMLESQPEDSAGSR